MLVIFLASVDLFVIVGDITQRNFLGGSVPPFSKLRVL